MPSLGLELEKTMLTSWVGAVLSVIENVASPPASLVRKGLTALMITVPFSTLMGAVGEAGAFCEAIVSCLGVSFGRSAGMRSMQRQLHKMQNIDRTAVVCHRALLTVW